MRNVPSPSSRDELLKRGSGSNSRESSHGICRPARLACSRPRRRRCGGHRPGSRCPGRAQLQEIDWGKVTSAILTSTGPFVGTAVASVYDLERLFASQLGPDENEVGGTAFEATMTTWWTVVAEGGDDSRKVGVAMGRISQADPVPVPAATRRQVVASCLVTGIPTQDKAEPVKSMTGRRSWAPPGPIAVLARVHRAARY